LANSILIGNPDGFLFFIQTSVQNRGVKFEGNVLTIKGERQREHEEKDENSHRLERSYGSFYRSLRLPSEVDTEKIKASHEKGVLRITIPKTKKEAGKKIEISAG